MPSMWLADFTLDLLTVRVCFRKYLLIFVKKKKTQQNKPNPALTNFVSCWQNQANKLCKAQKFLALLWASFAGCCRAEHIQVSCSLRGSAEGSFKLCPGRSWLCWGNTMSCVVGVAFVNIASCFHVNTVDSFSSGDFLFFLIHRAFIAPPKWNWCRLDKIHLWI